MKTFKNIKYKLKHTTRRGSIALSFGAGFLEVKAPKGIKNSVIEQFLTKHYNQILQHLENNNSFTRTYEQNEEFLINGEKYILKAEKAEKDDCCIDINIFKVYTTKLEKEYIKDIIVKYYEFLTKLEVTRLSKKYSKLMNVEPLKIKVNSAERRWGSCNYNLKTINFSARVGMLPDSVQEYIVIHELAHLIEPNHSYKFWSVVQQYKPDYKEDEIYLRQNSEFFKLK